MEKLDEVVFIGILRLLSPYHACSLGATSKTFQTWVDESPLWKEWCEHSWPSIQVPSAQAVIEEHYGARSDSGRTYKHLYVELARGPQPGVPLLDPTQPDHAQDLVIKLTNLEELPNLVLLVDVRAGNEVLLSFSAEGFEELDNIRRGKFLEDEFQAVDTKEKLRAVFDKSVAQFAVLCKPVPPPDFSHEADEAKDIDQQESPESIQALMSFSWRLMSKSDGRVRMLLEREVAFLSGDISYATPWGGIGYFVVRSYTPAWHSGVYFERGWTVSNFDRLSMETISEATMRRLCYKIFTVLKENVERVDPSPWDPCDWQFGEYPLNYEVEIGFYPVK